MTRLVLILGVLTGLVMGTGGYTFIYAQGDSCLTNDPAACANGHVMNDYYVKWQRSSHRAEAACLKCHGKIGHP